MRYGIFCSNWIVLRRFRRQLAEEVANFSGTVADVGCGASPYRTCFPKAARYLRFDRTSSHPEVTLADAIALPLETSSLDAILATQTLGDMPDLVGVLTEWTRVLAPSGRVLVFETMAYPEHDLPHDYWRVMPRGLEVSATAAGLRIARLERIGGLFARLATLLNSQCFERLARAPLLYPAALALIAINNIFALILDRLLPIPSAAPDYFAVLVRATERQLK
jgi:SAM-dependent methyltransferase